MTLTQQTAGLPAPGAPRRAHLVLQVDVAGPAVELLLQAGHHCVVAGHPVNAGGLQPSRLHDATARGHDQGHALGTQAGPGVREAEAQLGQLKDPMGGQESLAASRQHQGLAGTLARSSLPRAPAPGGELVPRPVQP